LLGLKYGASTLAEGSGIVGVSEEFFKGMV
jgi:hypothetical protein